MHRPTASDAFSSAVAALSSCDSRLGLSVLADREPAPAGVRPLGGPSPSRGAHARAPTIRAAPYSSTQTRRHEPPDPMCKSRPGSSAQVVVTVKIATVRERSYM